MALKPIFSRYNYGADHWQWGLKPDDFAKVTSGYACGRCLEDFSGVWYPACPVCGEETPLPKVVDIPPEWGPRH